jgi:hypothetical protein
MEERQKQLCSSSGFRIATQPPEIPLIGGTTLEIPVTLSRKFPGPEKELLFISGFWTVWQVSFELCPRGDGFRGGFLA